MKNFSLIAIATVAALSSVAAHADEFNGSEGALQFKSTRSVAEVRAEARNPVRISNGGTGFVGVTQSNVDSSKVKAQGAMAARNGETTRGEI